MLKSVSI